MLSKSCVWVLIRIIRSHVVVTCSNPHYDSNLSDYWQVSLSFKPKQVIVLCVLSVHQPITLLFKIRTCDRRCNMQFCFIGNTDIYLKHRALSLNTARCTVDWQILVAVLHNKITKICDSTYRKVPVVGRLDFELWRRKVKISQYIVPKSILRFHILWNLQYLTFKLLEGFGAQNSDFVSKYQYFVQIPKFQEPSPQNQLFTNLQWCPQ